jgi:putative SOS response-associated peptidase YedK
MCGRYAMTLPPEAARRLFGYGETPNFPPRYNIAPTQPIAVVIADLDGSRHFRLVRWGLIPGWSKDATTQSLLFNARSETAADKPSFRAAMRHRRCLVPADGFFEWKRQGEARFPYYIRRRDGGPMAFAGIWETWLGADGSEIDTGAILTTAANGLMARLHDRMPVILPPESWADWLDCANHRPEDVRELTRPAPDDLLEAIAVSERVNAVRNDDGGLLEPLAEPVVAEPAQPVRKTRPAQGELF